EKSRAGRPDPETRPGPANPVNAENGQLTPRRGRQHRERAGSAKGRACSSASGGVSEPRHRGLGFPYLISSVQEVRVPKGVAQRAEVVSAERLTPHMVRVVFSGPDGAPLAADPAGKTDAYVKVLFPRPGTGVEEPFDLEEVKERLSREDWPVMRAYPIRWCDGESGHAALDFVVHGAEWSAGLWAHTVQHGLQVQFFGPGGGYA